MSSERSTKGGSRDLSEISTRVSTRGRLRAPSSGIVPRWASWFYCRAPLHFYYLPERRRLQVTKMRLGPVGGWFTKDAVVDKVPIIRNSTVEEATVDGDHVRLRLSLDGARTSDLTFDHVIAATGYRDDLDWIALLGESLLARIVGVEKTPILSSNFESSVPALYFVGPAAANNFGPVQRFAFGARFG